MRIVIDLDGVICPVRRDGQAHADLEPVPGAVEKLKALREAGHVIIIQTARHMKTCDGNVGMVMKRLGKIMTTFISHVPVPAEDVQKCRPNPRTELRDHRGRFRRLACRWLRGLMP